jgi:hypothetical protein
MNFNEPDIENRKKLLKLVFNLKPLLVREKDEIDKSLRLKEQSQNFSQILSKELNIKKLDLEKKISEIFKKEREKYISSNYTDLQNQFLKIFNSKKP